ncbi:hypothetical protein AWZ03_014259 [Drosophila navojoa]|uniref:Uncharacterized protein n=1 Tax=Drosophila navojoa TaxID=7232 RepID=A0A484ARV3_DRONA|nr:hypothetical protein AWZ03_014259 [Drosophila navojoa]
MDMDADADADTDAIATCSTCCLRFLLPYRAGATPASLLSISRQRGGAAVLLPSGAFTFTLIAQRVDRQTQKHLTRISRECAANKCTLAHIVGATAWHGTARHGTPHPVPQQCNAHSATEN